MADKIKVEKIVERGSSCRLHISTLPEPLKLPLELVLRHRLLSGIVITQAQLDQLRRESEEITCVQHLTRLLAMREHSIGEAKQKLRKKEFSPETIDKVIKSFEQRSLLDDARYAMALARRVLERSPSGRSFLIAHLRRKMLSSEIAEQTTDMLLQSEDEVEIAARALKRLWSRFSQFDLETARHKAYTYLSRRGIRYDAARSAFERLTQEQIKDRDH